MSIKGVCTQLVMSVLWGPPQAVSRGTGFFGAPSDDDDGYTSSGSSSGSSGGGSDTDGLSDDEVLPVARTPQTKLTRVEDAVLQSTRAVEEAHGAAAEDAKKVMEGVVGGEEVDDDEYHFPANSLPKEWDATLDKPWPTRDQFSAWMETDFDATPGVQFTIQDYWSFENRVLWINRIIYHTVFYQLHESLNTYNRAEAATYGSINDEGFPEPNHDNFPPVPVSFFEKRKDYDPTFEWDTNQDNVRYYANLLVLGAADIPADGSHYGFNEIYTYEFRARQADFLILMAAVCKEYKLRSIPGFIIDELQTILTTTHEQQIERLNLELAKLAKERIVTEQTVQVHKDASTRGMNKSAAKHVERLRETSKQALLALSTSIVVKNNQIKKEKAYLQARNAMSEHPIQMPYYYYGRFQPWRDVVGDEFTTAYFETLRVDYGGEAEEGGDAVMAAEEMSEDPVEHEMLLHTPFNPDDWKEFNNTGEEGKPISDKLFNFFDTYSDKYAKHDMRKRAKKVRSKGGAFDDELMSDQEEGGVDSEMDDGDELEEPDEVGTLDDMFSKSSKLKADPAKKRATKTLTPAEKARRKEQQANLYLYRQVASITSKVLELENDPFKENPYIELDALLLMLKTKTVGRERDIVLRYFDGEGLEKPVSEHYKGQHLRFYLKKLNEQHKTYHIETPSDLPNNKLFRHKPAETKPKPKPKPKAPPGPQPSKKTGKSGFGKAPVGGAVAEPPLLREIDEYCSAHAYDFRKWTKEAKPKKPKEFNLAFWQESNVERFRTQKALKQGVMFGDPMGMGKTISAIACIVETFKTKPNARVLILSPKKVILRKTWYTELLRVMCVNPYEVVNTGLADWNKKAAQKQYKRGNQQEIWNSTPQKYDWRTNTGARVFLLTTNMLQQRLDATVKSGNAEELEVRKSLATIDYDLVIVDEVHELRNIVPHEAKRFSAMKAITHKTLKAGGGVVCLSATPLVSTWQDFAAYARLLYIRDETTALTPRFKIEPREPPFWRELEKEFSSTKDGKQDEAKEKQAEEKYEAVLNHVDKWLAITEGRDLPPLQVWDVTFSFNAQENKEYRDLIIRLRKAIREYAKIADNRKEINAAFAQVNNQIAELEERLNTLGTKFVDVGKGGQRGYRAKKEEDAKQVNDMAAKLVRKQARRASLEAEKKESDEALDGKKEGRVLSAIVKLMHAASDPRFMADYGLDAELEEVEEDIDGGVDDTEGDKNEGDKEEGSEGDEDDDDDEPDGLSNIEEFQGPDRERADRVIKAYKDLKAGKPDGNVTSTVTQLLSVAEMFWKNLDHPDPSKYKTENHYYHVNDNLSTDEIDESAWKTQNGVENTNRKVIIFSQFTTHLYAYAEILQAHFNLRYTPQVFHGGIKEKQQDIRIQNFQTKSDFPFLLMNLKAGGVGLNLQEASGIIYTDVWWNKSCHDQATARAHRAGQSRDVRVAFVLPENSIGYFIRNTHHTAQEHLWRDTVHQLIAPNAGNADATAEAADERKSTIRKAFDSLKVASFRIIGKKSRAESFTDKRKGILVQMMKALKIEAEEMDDDPKGKGPALAPSAAPMETLAPQGSLPRTPSKRGKDAIDLTGDSSGDERKAAPKKPNQTKTAARQAKAGVRSRLDEALANLKL